MNFAAISASQAWEPISIADSAPDSFWVWFKPPSVPQGFVARFADGAFTQPSSTEPLTMRKLLSAVGVDARWVAMWQQFGVPVDSQNGTTPYLDQPISGPAAGVVPDIVVYVQMMVATTVPQAMAPQAMAPASHETSVTLNILANIEASWNSSLEIEKELTVRRKRLADMLGRLNTLNRDLSTDERLSATRQDIDEWTNARRWLREAAGRLSRFIKEHDVGETTSAMKRRWFDKMYRQFVVHRQPFEGMEQASREYEGYRQTHITLLNNMNTALSNASQQGERRAQQVLSRITSQTRRSNSKKP